MSTFKTSTVDALRLGVAPNRYFMPTSDGTSGQYIQTDGSGNLSWQTSLTRKVYYTLTNVEVIATGVDDTPTNFPTTTTITTTGSDTFNAGDIVVIAGSTSNDGSYTVVSHSGTTLTVVETLTVEASTGGDTLSKSTAVADFAWDNTAYVSYSSGTVRFFVEWVDDVLSVELYDVTNAASLGSLTGINSDGMKSFSVTNPSSDARLELRVSKIGSGTEPSIHGCVIEYITTAVLSSEIKYSRSAVSATPYTALATDEIIGVDTSTLAITVNLPQINTIGGGDNHKKYFIIDESGDAAANNITISGTGGDTINGAASTLIATNYGSVSLYSDGTSNWVIF